jgi:hypothetical protein
MGASEPIVEYLDLDTEYAAELLGRAAAFWRCVETGEPPVELPAVPAPIDAKATYDMTGDNEWADKAWIWLHVKHYADECWQAEKVLKSRVPPDAKRCTGHGVVIVRNRAGHLSLREHAE